MKSILGSLVALALLLAFAPVPASAEIALFEFGLNLDGTVYDSLSGPLTLPGSVNAAAFDFATGLGTITITTTAVGPHNFAVFLDHEIDETDNTFFNEYGAQSGAVPSWLSWEIDEPGWNPPYGDIYANFLAGTPDNTNGVPSSAPNDVSMALGWDFTLGAGERGTVRFSVGTTAPTSGFYLAQTDPDSDKTIYLATNLTTDTTSFPEPGPLLLLALMAGTVFGAVRFRLR